MSARIPPTVPSVTPPLLGADEPPPVSVINPGGRAKCLLVCDHASNRVPRKLGTLGLAEEELQKHSSWDIGAREATLLFAELLDAQAVIANYSRMVVDLNRRLDHPTIFPTSSEGVPVPGNIEMNEADGALLNPAGLTQFGVSLHDAIKTMPFPVIEVHISNRHAREHWRGHSIISPAVKATVEGLGWRSYTAALRALVEILKEKKS